MTLLIVEESLAICRLVRALIEDLPVAVSECHDAARALAACAESQPDWVLMDLTLAGGDALAVVRQIRALYPGTRVLLLSQESDPRLRGIAARAGAWAMLHTENLIELSRFLDPSAEASERTSPTKGEKE
jgi:CheY-like chemotaxis protein